MATLVHQDPRHSSWQQDDFNKSQNTKTKIQTNSKNQNPKSKIRQKARFRTLVLLIWDLFVIWILVLVVWPQSLHARSMAPWKEKTPSRPVPSGIGRDGDLFDRGVNASSPRPFEHVHAAARRCEAGHAAAAAAVIGAHFVVPPGRASAAAQWSACALRVPPRTPPPSLGCCSKRNPPTDPGSS